MWSNHFGGEFYLHWAVPCRVCPLPLGRLCWQTGDLKAGEGAQEAWGQEDRGQAECCEQTQLSPTRTPPSWWLRRVTAPLCALFSWTNRMLVPSCRVRTHHRLQQTGHHGQGTLVLDFGVSGHVGSTACGMAAELELGVPAAGGLCPA